MSNTLVRVFVHYVWTTRYRDRLLVGDARQKVKAHISSYATYNRLTLETIAVQPEHVHALLRLPQDQRIEDVAKLLKGESSQWINSNDITPLTFSWETGYAAFSVDHNGVEGVKQFIARQDLHHRDVSFDDELLDLMRTAGYSDAVIAQMLKRTHR